MKKLLILGALICAFTAQAETIQLDADIDYVQATYSEVSGGATYTFLLTNYDNDAPAIRLQVNARSKTSIWGVYSPDLTYSKLTIVGDPDDIDLTISSASLSIGFVSKDAFGDCTYTIHVEVVASDGNTYTYDGEQVIYAFDVDDDYEYIELDESAGPPTGLSHSKNAIAATKILRNGQVLIERNGKTYDAQGIRVE